MLQGRNYNTAQHTMGFPLVCSLSKVAMTHIADRLASLRLAIETYEARYERPAQSVKLVAVSKTHPIAAITEAIAAGLLAFGENYLQEALPKIAATKDYTLEWHFIGPIQSNKTRKIAENFHWVHSVCEIKIAERLNLQRPTDMPPLNICLQVNISHEPTKSGIDQKNVAELAAFCETLPNLRLRGLMIIPAPQANFEKQREEFKKCRLLSEDLCAAGFNLDTLSMGMSDDLEAAIAEGSTLVRIGTSLFGIRP